MHGHLQGEGSPGEDTSSAGTGRTDPVGSECTLPTTEAHRRFRLESSPASWTAPGNNSSGSSPEGNRTVWTVRNFYERFLEEYRKPRPRCLRRYALSFKSLNAVLGNIPWRKWVFSLAGRREPVLAAM